MTQSSDNAAPVVADWAGNLLDFWFNEVGEAGWYSSDPGLDMQCVDRFSALWADKQNLAADTFLARADEALAAILLFDQLPRNMFRGTAVAYTIDPLARDIARGAIARSYDIQIGGAGRLFFYMPFMHSEAIDDQQMSLTLFEGAGGACALDFTYQHHAMIAPFGRFPQPQYSARPRYDDKRTGCLSGRHQLLNVIA